MQETTPPYLTQYGRMAERHWREFRPRMVRELEAQGRLMEMLFDAQETTKTEMESLRTEFRKQGLTEQQAHDQAWEIVRTRYILLAPEETGSD
ncbi:MAG: TnpV protein [Chthoniobacteraceae bacterium]